MLGGFIKPLCSSVPLGGHHAGSIIFGGCIEGLPSSVVLTTLVWQYWYEQYCNISVGYCVKLCSVLYPCMVMVRKNLLEGCIKPAKSP